MTSAQSGNTQLFYPASNDALSEGNSAGVLFRGGQQDLRYPIPFSAKWVRWDPLNGPGEFAVERPLIDSPFWSIAVDPAQFFPRSEIQAITREQKRLVVTTTPQAVDPAVGIELPRMKIILAQLGIAAAFALLAGLFAIFVSRAAFRNAAAGFLGWGRRQVRTFERVPHFTLLAAVFWFSSLASYMISVDDELAMLRVDQGVWAAQGRWTTYLLTRFVLPQPVVPFMVHAMFCLLASAAYVLLLRAHGVAADRKSFALFPVFVAFPVWFFIGEFYGNFFSAAVGLFMVAVAIDLFHTSVVREGVWAWRRVAIASGIQAAIVGTAMGAYQSFILGYACIGVGVILFAATRRPQLSVPFVLRQLGALVASTVGGAAFYAAVSRLFRSALGQEVAYVDSFVKPAFLLAQPLAVVQSTFREAFDFYAGSPIVYGAGFGAVGALMILGTVSIFRSVKGVGPIALVAGLVLACLGLPFALTLVAGGATMIPYRALVGVPYVVWLFAAFALHDRRAIWRALTVVALACAAFQLAYLHSAYSGAVALSLEHDKAMAAAIHARIVEKIPDFNRHAGYQIDLFGAKSFASSTLPRVPTSTIGRGFFDWDGGNADRILYLMKIIGYDGLVSMNQAERKALIGEYESMPLWPADQSVRRVGNAVLIKLGNSPGSTHQF